MSAAFAPAMLVSWWMIWLAVMFLFCISPVGYGWGYRGWGPPYPRYIQRQRSNYASGHAVDFDHHAWGWRGDFVWTIFSLCALWAILSICF
jgi:hypothetical protein